MNRALQLLTLLLACSVVAACGEDDHVKILVFQAAPDAIEVGQSTKLVFAVDPPDAKVDIGGIGDMTGQTQASVSPTATTSYQLTAKSGSATDTASVTVTVGATSANAVKVEPASATTTAGVQLAVTLTVLGNNGKTAPGFRGTLKITSTDLHATLPADVTFGASDAGVKQITVTLTTAGPITLTATETSGKAGVAGSATLTVQAAAAQACVASQAPATAIAGSLVGLTVTVKDPFGNSATGYAGTVHVTASDSHALLPSDVTYVPASDAGRHAFSVSLVTTGDQVVTATDTVDPAITCNVTVKINPADRTLVLALPSDANAGYPVNVGVAVMDRFGNAIPDYTGTVTFVSSDTGAGAATPPAITFAGTEGGVATTTVMFSTIGLQLLSASDGGTPQAVGSVAARVHGLVYTAPDVGRVRLVASVAGTSTNTVQLDLVANERLEISTFFGGGPGSFSAGMNLPLDTTRAGAGSPLFTPGNALPLGTGVPAALGVLAGDHVLYTAVSRKRVAGTIFSQVTEVQRGQVFYSVKLKLTPNGAPGAVFDGAQPMAMYRAGVRDQWGNDFVGQGDIGIGKLEVR